LFLRHNSDKDLIFPFILFFHIAANGLAMRSLGF
jgi:hypothetical protein